MRRNIFRLVIVCAILVAIAASIAMFRRNDIKYCRIRFGTAETHEVVLARTSDSLLLYRDGSLASAPERYAFKDGRMKEGELIAPIKTLDGHSYQITSLSEYVDDETVYRHALMLNVEIEGDVAFSQYCDVELCKDRNDLKLAHFDGLLSIGPVTGNWKISTDTRFVIDGEPTDIRTNVATLDEKNGCWTVVESGKDKFPEGVYPSVTVEFPAKQSSEPVIQSYPLDRFC